MNPATRPALIPVPSLVFPAGGQLRLFKIPEGTIGLGAAPTNEVILEDERVQGRHAEIVRGAGRILLRGLSEGEILVNETPLAGEHSLKPGDLIRMGSTTLRLILAGMPRPAAPLAPPAPSRAPEPPPEPPPPPAGTYGSVERSAASLDVRAILAERRAPEEPLAPESAARRSSVPAAGDGALARRRAAELGKALHEIRSLTDQIVREGDFEILLERVASAFLDIFEADRGVCVLFEEDGRNPLLTVERQRSGSEEGAGISRKVIDRVLEARTVIRVNAVTPDGAEGVGFASPLLSETRPLGVLYFERAQASLGTIAADELHFIGIISNCVALAIRSLL